MPKKIFISYSSYDRTDAFAVMRLLKKQGCEVWLDYFDITPSKELEGQLKLNIKGADVICILLSPTSVESKWVNLEFKLASEKGSDALQILPIILRPCSIPSHFENMVGVDASEGMGNEAVILRIVRAVLGEKNKDDSLLLTAAERALLAEKEQQTKADVKLPSLVKELDRVMDIPIHDIEITLDHSTIPIDQPTIIELQLILDPLWTQPMSFYFAKYKEGVTWPKEFDFHEPPYTEYFKQFRSRVDAKFKWFDIVKPLNQSIDGTDFHQLPASFSLHFDGEKFHPGGQGVHVQQQFEIPSLRKLRDQKSHFKLIAHYPQEKRAEYLDAHNSDVDLTIDANYREIKPAWVRLYKSHHHITEQNILNCDTLTNVENTIEKEALLSLYWQPDTSEVHERKLSIVEAIKANDDIDEEDWFMAANYCYSEALLVHLRGQDHKMLQLLEKTVKLLEPMVLEAYPTYEQGMLMFQACEKLVTYFTLQKKYQRAADFVNCPGLVAQRLIDLDPKEADYWRIWSEALYIRASVLGENGDQQNASADFTECMNTKLQLYQQFPSKERLRDAQDTFAKVMDYSTKWHIEDQLPVAEWQGTIRC